jgi:LmbE family N-acetylglucosaminyl deacetylase
LISDHKRISRSLVLFLSICAAALAQLRPERLPQDTGETGLNQALKKLKTTGRLMQTTAHPDDEDGALLAYMSRGRGVATMLFTLTRGDGGQNKTGSNLFDELGVLRTLELLESGRFYGAEQRFAHVADFGFSKDPQEAFQKWGKDVVLADMVRVIREFRPDVIAAGWSGTPNDGHGHHQASGLLTPEAVRLAADPTKYPEAGPAWQVQKLYYRTRGDNYTVRVDAAQVDPNLGKSYAEFGVEGYSHQKSQNAEMFKLPSGPIWRSYRMVENTVGKKYEPGEHENDFFDGIDTALPGIASRLGDEEKKVPFLRPALVEIDKLVDEAIRTRHRNLL